MPPNPRYGNEIDRLWRRVICVKNETDLNFLSLSLSRRSNTSTLVTLIGSFLDINDLVAFIEKSHWKWYAILIFGLTISGAGEC